MPLQKQYWEMIFGQAGRNARSDEKVLQSPQLLELINGEIVSPGKIQKRTGYVSLEASPDSDNNLSVSTRVNRGGVLTAIGDRCVSDFNSDLEWTNDPVSLITSSESRIVVSSNKYKWSKVDIAYYDNYYHMVATREVTSGTTYFYLFTFDSDFNLIKKSRAVATPYPVKIAVFNSVIGVVYRVTNSLYIAYINQSTFALGSGTLIASNCHLTAPYIDVTACGSTSLYVAYSNNTPGVTVLEVNTSGAVMGSDTYNTDGAADGAIAIQASEHGSDRMLLVLCNQTNACRHIIYDVDLNRDYTGSGTFGNTDVDQVVIASIDSDTHYHVLLQRPGSGDIGSSVSKYLIEGSDINLGFAFMTGHGSALIHKAVGYEVANVSGPVLGLCRQQDDFCVYYTCQIKEGEGGTPYTYRFEPVAKYLHRLSSGIGGDGSPTGAVSNCVEGDITNKYVFAAITSGDEIALCSFQYAADGADYQKRLYSARLENDIIIAGSIPLIWDGTVARELGFSHPPAILSDAVGSGGSIADGTYNFIIVYKVKDNTGRVYKSIPSLPHEVVVSGGGGSADVEIEFIGSIRRDDWDEAEDTERLAVAELYRTEASGSIYYKSAEQTVSGENAWFSEGGVPSHPTITSEQSDANLISEEQLYTTGGVLERCGPPPLDDVVIHDNRIWGIDSDTGNIPYSSEIIEGEGPWFSDTFVVSNLPGYGKPVRIVDTQSFLLVFYKNNIGAIYGQGFNDLGIDGNLSTVKIIANNIGCSEPKTVVKTPNGVIFKAESGFHIIGYDGSPPQYIGAGVSDYDSSVVVSADLIPDKKHVRFALSGTDEPLLVYNYEFNQWYIWGYDIGGTWIEKTGGCVIGTYHYLVAGDTGNTLIQDNSSIYDYVDGYIDGTYDTDHYVFSVTTPWIKLAGLQGFQRVLKAWILGTFESDHNMTVEIDYDYDDSNTDTVTITDLSTEIGEDLYQVRIGIPNQRCQSIRFKITIDTSGYSAGAGATLSGLRLEYMAKRGGMRSPNYG